MLPVAQIARDDRAERGIIERASGTARREARQNREIAAANSIPPGRSTRAASRKASSRSDALGEMIERAEHQHGIHAGIALGERSRIADARARERRGLPRLLHVQRHGVGRDGRGVRGP
jgi:hypothetical protein